MPAITNQAKTGEGHDAPEPPSPGRKLSARKKALFAATVCGAVLGLVELVLTLCGVQPVLYDEDPYVGFSSHVPLFVAETGPDGNKRMVTAKNKLRFFCRQEFPQSKPAGTYRIFCMGGSTTYGRPYDDATSFCGWLRAMLPEADPSRRWELINAGGISYASYRVAVLMEELIRYEPDLFIIYSGHNEFLERRTYSGIIETPGAVRGLVAILSRTRTYTAIKRAVDALGGRPGADVAEPEHLADEVDAILDETIGPAAYHRDDELRKRVLEHYRYNLTRMIAIARSVGAKVILVTPASNLRHCSPFKSQHREGLGETEGRNWAALFERAGVAHAAGRWHEALEAIDGAVAIDDRYAHLHYLRGQVLWELQRYDQAKAAFLRSREEDVCPLRALTPMREIVAQVAAERGVPAVDFVGVVERQSEHATPGESLFLDHVHPTIECNRRLALALLEAMSEGGIVHSVSTWADATIRRVTDRVKSGVDPKAHGLALRNLSKVLGWAGKFEEGRRAAVHAIQLTPEDAEAHFLAAVNAWRVGRTEEAIGHYRQAVRFDPTHAKAHCNLGTALQSQGKLDEAISHLGQAVRLNPKLSKARVALGSALASQGKLDEAISQYRQALQVDPHLAVAHRHLGSALSAQGQWDEAISHYRQVVQAMPRHAPAHYDLGLVLAEAGRGGEALPCLREAIRLQIDWPAPLNSAAWILATNADPNIRGPDEAIRLAQRASELTEHRDPTFLDTLAAAYAAAGRFDQAVTTAELALELATAAQADEQASAIRKRLALFRQAKPHREPR